MRQIIGFYHVATIGNWLSVFNEQVEKLKKSGLLAASKYVYVSVVGTGKISSTKKLHVCHTSNRLRVFEHPTLYKLHQLSLKEDFDCFYFHTKGVSIKKNFDERFNQRGQVNKHGYLELKTAINTVKYWRLFLEYFTIEKWKNAVKELQNYDCVGVNWKEDPWRHFGGNFWWSKSEYLRTLKDIYSFPSSAKFKRMQSEEWIGQDKNIRIKNLSSFAPTYRGMPILPFMYR